MSITIQCNLKTIDFLDVTFDLNNNVHKPFRKENNKPIYINKHFNHPPSILKQLPKSIEISEIEIEIEIEISEISIEISETSSNKDIFDESIKRYKQGCFKRK